MDYAIFEIPLKSNLTIKTLRNIVEIGLGGKLRIEVVL